MLDKILTYRNTHVLYYGFCKIDIVQKWFQCKVSKTYSEPINYILHENIYHIDVNMLTNKNKDKRMFDLVILGLNLAIAYCGSR